MDGLANTIATCISALAACLSTYLAARAIKDNREMKRAEMEGLRPYFSFSNFGLKRPSVANALSEEMRLLDPRLARIEGLLSNDGQRAATHVSGGLFLLPISAARKPGFFPIGIADDVSPKSEWRIGTALLPVVPADYLGVDVTPDFVDPGFFVLACIRYVDPLSSKRYAQNSLMRWPGIRGGVVAGDLLAAERLDKSAILELHGEFLQEYIKEGLVLPTEPPSS